MPYRNKTVVLGVTGGIAIYKTPELIRSLKKRGLNVEVVMTKSAQEFITPLTFKEVSGNPVHLELFSHPSRWVVAHISLARKADLMRSEEHTSELQSRPHLVCRLLLEKKKNTIIHSFEPFIKSSHAY